MLFYIHTHKPEHKMYTFTCLEQEGSSFSKSPGFREIAQEVKTLAVKPNDSSSNSESHVEDGENQLPQVAL